MTLDDSCLNGPIIGTWDRDKHIRALCDILNEL